MDVFTPEVKSKTKQEIFDIVYRHLLTQKQKSLSDEANNQVCVYRNKDGLSCAAGCLIPDEEYNVEMEGLKFNCRPNEIVNKIGDKEKVENFIKIQMKLGLFEERNFIRELQRIHDDFPVEEWEEWLTYTAKSHNLSIPQL